MSSRVLSIDPATTCGWAFFEDSQRVSSGVLNFSTIKNQHSGQRFNNALEAFKNLLVYYKPDTVVYEAVKRWSSSQAALVYGGIVSMLQATTYLQDIPIYGIAPTQAKKFCTGNGRAQKEEMILWANKTFSFEAKDDNEADALALGYTYIHERANLQKPADNPSGTSKSSKPKRSRKNISTTDS
jgi:Holliday junction resolvasome RuvABC endonuclease subunit